MSTSFDVKINAIEDIKLRNEYLEKRGLTVSQFPEQVLHVARGDGVLKEMGIPPNLACGRPFMLMRYLNAKGQFYDDPQFLDMNGDPVPFQIARFLGQPRPDLEAKLKSGVAPKSAGQTNRGTELHFSDLSEAPFDWFSVPIDVPILIVESMVKAIKVSQELGLPVIGLCGVNTFSNPKRGRDFILSECGIDFKSHRVVILLDANVATKDGPREAQESLAYGLKYKLGCQNVKVAALPPVDGDYNAGPDDYIVAHGPEALLGIIKESVDYSGAANMKAIMPIHERAFYVKGIDAVVDRPEKRVMTIKHASNYYAKYNLTVPKGKGTSTIISFNEWRGYDKRNEVEGVDYEYLGEELIEREGLQYFNTYRESGVWTRGSREYAAPLIEHFKAIFGEKYGLVMSYIKFLKFSNKRPTNFLYMYSRERGVGKSMFTTIVEDLMGESNATMVNANVFKGKFNALMAGKRFVRLDEFNVPGPEKAEAIGRIKEVIGNDTMVIEPKGIDGYKIHMSMGLIMTSNDIEGAVTDGLEDRRMEVIKCYPAPGSMLNDHEENPAYWKPLWALKKDHRALEGLLAEIEAAEDVDFDARRASMDEEKLEVTTASFSPTVQAALQALDMFRSMNPKIVCLHIDTIYKYVCWIMQDNPNKMSVSKQLPKAGWRASNRKYSTLAGGRVWIVDEIEFKKIEDDGAAVRAAIIPTMSLSPEKF